MKTMFRILAIIGLGFWVRYEREQSAPLRKLSKAAYRKLNKLFASIKDKDKLTETNKADLESILDDLRAAGNVTLISNLKDLFLPEEEI